MVKFNYIDLFSGIGGFALGLKQAGIEFENHWFSEIDKHTINIYKKHFPNAKELGDVKTIRDVSGIKADLITFGFPCQDLSTAGKRRGLEGSRSRLFYEAIRIIRELSPRYFIFENVKGLLTSNRGMDFVRCLREIADIGLYDCEWQLVNTAWFLPQKRERIYFIGHSGRYSGQQIFPLKITTPKNYKFIEKKKRTLVWRAIIDITSANKNQNGGMIDENLAFTLTTRKSQGVFDGENIRFLTPLEKERLQGFPDGWSEFGYDGFKIPETFRHKALGNAVSVPIPQYIGSKILEIERKTNK
nr:MAG TPA: Cytosine specific methyltransferase [Caudoviricetes sp.]